MKLRADFISDLKISVFFSAESFFRHYQYLFLGEYGKEFQGELIELGGKHRYNHKRFFPNVSSFRCTNIGTDSDDLLDITQMNLKDVSVDGFLCISVLEHVYSFQRAVQEMERTLKPGGKLLLSVPFAYPHHDVVDYWRMTKDAYMELLKNFEVRRYTHLGGLFSTIIDSLRRPRKNWKRRYLVYKLLGLLILVTFRFLDTPDGLPVGVGVYAIKK